jgi:hypothetical protein
MPRVRKNLKFLLPAVFAGTFAAITCLSPASIYADAKNVLAARIAYVRAKIANRRAQQNKINVQWQLHGEFKSSPEVNTTMEQFRWATK